MRKKLALIFVALAIAALWVTPAFAAQGQITEVNPSGVNTVNQTDPPTGSDPGQKGAGNANGNAERTPRRTIRPLTAV